jgi:signal transduction histidine kinase
MVRFSKTVLAQLWPAYAVIDQNLVIIEAGPALTRRFGGHWKGKLATDFFGLKPSLFSKKKPTNGVEFSTSEISGVTLTGLAVTTEENCWCLLMNFNVSDLNVALRLGLSSKDFGVQSGQLRSIMSNALKSGLLKDLNSAVEELAITKDLLMRSIETRLQITNYLCHDFTNLLSVISFDAARLSANVSKKARFKIAENIKQASALGTHVSKSISKMSSISTLEVIHLDHWISENLALMRSAVGGAELVTELSSDGERLYTDSSELLFALLNLLINAKEASMGTGPITIRTRRIKRDTSWGLVISIHDCGHPDSRISSLPTTSNKGPGRGLGLISVRHFCDQFDGELVLETAANDGTVVSIILPAHPQS